MGCSANVITLFIYRSNPFETLKPKTWPFHSTDSFSTPAPCAPTTVHPPVASTPELAAAVAGQAQDSIIPWSSKALGGTRTRAASGPAVLPMDVDDPLADGRGGHQGAAESRGRGAADGHKERPTECDVRAAMNPKLPIVPEVRREVVRAVPYVLQPRGHHPVLRRRKPERKHRKHSAESKTLTAFSHPSQAQRLNISTFFCGLEFSKFKTNPVH